MDNEKNISGKKGQASPKPKKIILPPSVEEKMKSDEDKKEVSEAGKLQEKLAKSEQDLKKLSKEYLLLQAEFSNFQKRQRKMDEDRAKYAIQPFVSSLLTHIDTFEKALTLDSKVDAQKILDGFMLIYNGISKVFKDFNIEVIVPEKGSVINLEQQEVISTAEDANAPNNTVFDVIQKGYMLTDRVIRPAKVIAVKNSEPEIDVEKSETDESENMENLPEINETDIIEESDNSDEISDSKN